MTSGFEVPADGGPSHPIFLGLEADNGTWYETAHTIIPSVTVERRSSGSGCTGEKIVAISCRCDRSREDELRAASIAWLGRNSQKDQLERPDLMSYELDGLNGMRRESAEPHVPRDSRKKSRSISSSRSSAIDRLDDVMQ